MECARDEPLVVGSTVFKSSLKMRESAWHLRWTKRGSTALTDNFLRQVLVPRQATQQ
jgi:hypothetical protein